VSVEASDRLHEDVQAAIVGSDVLTPWPDAQFDELAGRLVAHQASCAPLRRFWAGRGLDADAVPGWRSIPPVPTDVWKHVDLFAFDSSQAVSTLLTSGTTVGTRGRHLLRRTDTYDVSLQPPLDAFLLPGGEPLPILVLGAPLAADPVSSLGHMLQWAVDLRGGPGSEHLWDGGPDLARAEARLRGADGPVVLLATARALAALLDGLDGPIALPPGSRVMETGGFKGGPEQERAAFHARVAPALGLPAAAVVAEYGMTELGSQGWGPGWAMAHDPALRERWGVLGDDPDRFVFPPWCRVAAVDPDTLVPLPDGQRGLLAFWDLANIDSCLAVQTADVGVVTPHGVLLEGRAPGARPRGCSLAVDEILQATR